MAIISPQQLFSYPESDLFNPKEPPSLEKYSLDKILEYPVFCGPETSFTVLTLVNKWYPLQFPYSYPDDPVLLSPNAELNVKVSRRTGWYRNAYKSIPPGLEKISITEYFDTTREQLSNTRALLSTSESTSSAFLEAQTSAELATSERNEARNTNGQPHTKVATLEGGYDYLFWEYLLMIKLEFEGDAILAYPNEGPSAYALPNIFEMGVLVPSQVEFVSNTSTGSMEFG